MKLILGLVLLSLVAACTPESERPTPSQEPPPSQAIQEAATYSPARVDWELHFPPHAGEKHSRPLSHEEINAVVAMIERAPKGKRKSGVRTVFRVSGSIHLGEHLIFLEDGTVTIRNADGTFLSEVFLPGDYYCGLPPFPVPELMRDLPRLLHAAGTA
jgi:hypothetical protein